MENDFVIDGDQLIPKSQEEVETPSGYVLPGKYCFICELPDIKIIATFQTNDELKQFIGEWTECH